MITHYLAFPDETTFLSIAEKIGATSFDENGQIILNAYTREWSIDVVGAIVKTILIENTDGEDPQIISTTIPGYHVNIVYLNGDSLPEEFAEYVVTPKTPCRNFS